jgi:hypothetical protein
MILESQREDVMKDIKADWRRWTRQTIGAAFIALGQPILVAALLFLGAG